jgi:hypothetical protein
MSGSSCAGTCSRLQILLLVHGVRVHSKQEPCFDSAWVLPDMMTEVEATAVLPAGSGAPRLQLRTRLRRNIRISQISQQVEWKSHATWTVSASSL